MLFQTRPFFALAKQGADDTHCITSRRVGSPGISVTANFNVDPDDGGQCDPDWDDNCACDDFGSCIENPYDDPLVFNLSGGPWQLTGLNNPVQFDIRASGQLQATSWTSAGADIAFLALDRNGDGLISDMSELFVNRAKLANGRRANNGFEALAQYDTNNDGIIDSADPIWKSLLLWTDRNHDGISQRNELTPIALSELSLLS